MKKNRKRIVAAFMTILMALTLVPTWLLGGVFATTAKADNTVELSGVAMATTVKDKKDKNTFGDSFGRAVGFSTKCGQPCPKNR